MSIQPSFLGQLLDSRYRVVSLLAAGGFGQTYIAEDTRRPGNPKCVVKHLKPASSDLRFLDHARRLFATEAETLEKLGHHEQIPRLLAYFEENEEFFLVQELVDGHPLISELHPGKQWAENQIYPLLWEVLNVLVFVHGNNVIHRDIKPENLLRRHSDRRFVLVDFGTVKQVRTYTAFQGQATATISVGTPGYMPTEQSHGRPRQNSDIYALGMTGIQAVTGLMPMQLPEDVETGELLWQDQAQISSELSNILAQMTRYHFKDRYQSATEVLQDLEGLMSRSEGVLINPRTSVTHLQPTAISLDDISLYRKTIIALSPTVISQRSINKSVEEAIAKPNIELTANPEWIEIELEPVSKLEVERIAEPLTEQFFESTSETEIVDLESIITFEVEPTIESIAEIVVQPIAESIIAHKPTEPEPIVEPTIMLAPDIKIDSGVQSPATVQPLWLMGIGALIGVGVIISGIYVSQRQAYLKAQEASEQVNVLRATGRYEECVQQASKVSEQYSDLYTQAQGAMGDCLLARAEALAKQRNFKEAIAQTLKISSNMKAYPQAQKLTNQSSEAILKTATEQYRQGKLQEAKAIAQAIPPNAAVAPRAKQTTQQWQTEWQRNEGFLEAARKSLISSKWQKALAQISNLKILGKPVSPSSVYWKTQVKEIDIKANRGIDAAAAKAAQQAPASSSSGSGHSEYEGYSGGSGNSGNYPAAAPPSEPSVGEYGNGWIERRL
jgi:serine/threonine protein kinase, bacterial